MKSILAGIIAAAVFALFAATVLNSEVQETTTDARQTSGVRL